ncbi:MAG TPA: ArsA family ATPase [Solirubrobacteraceae bacterium]|nr:ArsA family ATPase [Solirubrobacteraceae bacterium]
MPSPRERKLIVVTGKGGVGKTTVSAALGLLGARRGLRTIVVEVTGGETERGAGAAARLAALLDHADPPPHGEEAQLREGLLWGLSIDRDRVLAEWLRSIGGRVSARVLTSSSSFQYLIAAAPGAREMICMVKVWELAQGRRPAGVKDAGGYDLVILDAPATGHALAMLRSPRTFSTIARVGPIARQSEQVRELLEDPIRTAYVAVAQATEMAVTETLELREGLRRELGRELDAVVVNGALPRRFQGAELQRVAALSGEPANGLADGPAGRSTARPSRTSSAAHAAPAGASPTPTAAHASPAGASPTPTAAHASPGPSPAGTSVTRSAVRAAHSIHRRTRSQQSQIARLRREGIDVVTVPFAFKAELDLAAIEAIALRLDRVLSHSPGRSRTKGV